jgi:ribosomal-protein-alanine N-acetyltransferase
VDDRTVEMGQFPEIVTERLRLRCVSRTDAGAINALMTPRISRWLASWSHPLSVESATKRIQDLLESAKGNSVLPCMILGKETEQPIGWISVQRDALSPRHGELSYWIGEDYQGKGYAREAVCAMLPSAAHHLNLISIEAGAQIENAGSFSVMKGCGMVFGTEKLVYAPARERCELCRFYEWRPQT